MAGKRATRDDTEETRRAILRTAQRLFMEHGYRAVSTRQIAEACGLTQPALYHHFADKQDLYVEVMREWTAETRAALERIAHRHGGVEERLRAVARYIVQHTHTDSGMSIMMHDIRHELAPQAQAVMRELFESTYVAPIAGIIADGVRRGVVRAESAGGVAPAAAAFMFAGLVALYLPQTEGARGPRPDGHPGDGGPVDAAVRVLLHGLAVPGSEVAEPGQEGDALGEV